MVLARQGNADGAKKFMTAHLYWPGCLNSPKTEIPYHQKFPNAGIYTGVVMVFCYQNCSDLL